MRGDVIMFQRRIHRSTTTRIIALLEEILAQTSVHSGQTQAARPDKDKSKSPPSSACRVYCAGGCTYPMCVTHI